MSATLQDPGMQIPLDNTMGAMFLGVLLSAVLYGMSLVQTLYYYTHYPRDLWYLKVLVAITVVFDTVHMGFLTHSMYFYLIRNYYDHLVLGRMVWSILLEALFTGITAALVQCFYTLRVWRLSKGNVWLTGTILLLVFADAGCGTAWVILSMQLGTFKNLLKISGLTMTINALSSTVDVIIAVSLVTMLHRSRTGFPRTDTLISKMILFFVNTGLLTSIFAVGSLISMAVSPRSLIYASWYFCIGRLYVNSLLAALNARSIIQGKVDDVDVRMVTIPTTRFTTPSNTSSRSNSKPPLSNISIRVDTTKDSIVDDKIESEHNVSQQIQSLRIEKDSSNETE